MKVGVSLRSAFPPGDPRDAVRQMLARARAARGAGLDLLCVGDHHLSPVPYYQNTPILGRLLAEWGDRPAGALFLLPLWHPVLVAEQVATLAAIAAGPFVLQCALGAGAAQFAGMGVGLAERVARFEHNLDVVKRLLAGESVSVAGPGPRAGADGLEAVRVAPLPSEPVEIWIGASAPRAIERAARLGDTWYAGPELSREEAAQRLGVYREACARHGRSPASPPLRRDVFVAEGQGEIDRFARPVLERGYRGFPTGAVVVGGVEQVAEEFARFGALGFGQIVTRQLVDDPAAALASTERLGAVRARLAGA